MLMEKAIMRGLMLVVLINYWREVEQIEKVSHRYFHVQLALVLGIYSSFLVAVEAVVVQKAI